MSENLSILGIHDGHNCSATLVVDGQIVASINEERLTRHKNEVGYPQKAIEEVLRIGGLSPSQLDEVVYASLFMHRPTFLSDVTPWYAVGMADQIAAAGQPNDYQALIFKERRRERISQVEEHLDIPPDIVQFVEHHLAHLAAAYYTAPWREPGSPVLGLTCDGAGDNLSATVSTCLDNDIKRIATTSRHASLGKVYSRVTFLLGMIPWEHEYKIMGMAPYADSTRARKAKEVLAGLLKMSEDGLGFALETELSTNFCYEHLRDSYERVRFDTICGAVQAFTEDRLLTWVRNCVAKTGIHDVVAGGGVFMNVKANMLIAEMPEIDRLYVMPSSGDESLSIGAALHRHYEVSGQEDHRPSRIDNLYWGGAFGREAELRAIEVARSQMDIVVTESADLNDNIADLLADGETVALCRGRMEWGARALGNRSIVTSADDFARVDQINRAIKKRDFWMPFAPSIREEAANTYFDDPKNLSPWFMTIAYKARAERYAEIVAGSHPRDRTLRPQVVTSRANPEYYDLITKFEKKTGRGAILNTSFNLHGEPIVYTPSDALRVLHESGLMHLALNNFLISKRA